MCDVFSLLFLAFVFSPPPSEESKYIDVVVMHPI